MPERFEPPADHGGSGEEKGDNPSAAASAQTSASGSAGMAPSTT